PAAQSEAGSAELGAILGPMKFDRGRGGIARIVEGVGEIRDCDVSGQIGCANGDGVEAVGEREVKAVEPVGREFQAVGVGALSGNESWLIGEDAGGVTD